MPRVQQYLWGWHSAYWSGVQWVYCRAYAYCTYVCVFICIFMWVSHMLWIWFEGCFLWFRSLLAVFLQMFFFLIAEKLLVPISKNENKPLQTLPTLAKPAAALQTFNSAILTPVSNNNTGFLRNLLNSSGGKVCDISALACVDARLRLLFCGCSHHRHLSQ